MAWLAIVARGPPLAIPFPLSNTYPTAIVLVWPSGSSALRILSVYLLRDACVLRLVVRRRLSWYRTETRRGSFGSVGLVPVTDGDRPVSHTLNTRGVIDTATRVL